MIKCRDTGKYIRNQKPHLNRNGVFYYIFTPVYTASKKAIFYIDKHNLCIDSFTHELLHVYLSLKGVHVNGGLKNRIYSDTFFNSVPSNNLLEHIGNCLEHVKILPFYLEMGFDRNFFLYDYEVHKCSREEIENLEKHYRSNNTININFVDFYIGKIVAILADPNDEFDYSIELLKLKNLDNKLFNTINTLFHNWNEVKIKNKTYLDYDYTDVLNIFLEDLKEWKEINNFQNI